MDQKRLIQLAQLPLHQARPDHIDDPHLDILGRHGERARDVRIRQAARVLRLGRQAGEGQQADLAQQGVGIEPVGGEEGRVGVEPVGVVLEGLAVEEVEELVPGRVGLAERLDGVAVGQVLEDEVGRVREGGLAGAEGEVVRRRGGGVLARDGPQRPQQVRVRFVLVPDLQGRVGDLQEEGPLVLLVGLPEPDPAVEALQLRAQHLEQAGGADDPEDGEEDVVAGVGVVGQDVEDRGEDGEGEARTIVGGGRDRVAEVWDDFGEEDVEVRRLHDQVDEEVVGRDEFCWVGDTSQVLFKMVQGRCSNGIPYLSPVHCSARRCQ